jgi:predicted RNase H-like HicB family nuclease
MTTTYKVTTERSGNWWAFSVPEVPGAHGQAKRLEQVGTEARDVIAMMLEVPEDSFDVELDVKLDEETRRVVNEANEARSMADQYARLAAELTRAAAMVMQSRARLSTRDVGSLLGVSYQRVSQVLAEEKKAS